VTLVDSHAHLDFQQFDPDRDAVIARAQSAGVEWIVNVGVDPTSSRQAVDLATVQEMIFATVGMHPHGAKDLDSTAWVELRALAEEPKVVAVGEIGLDFYRDLSPRDTQRQTFEAQLAWAAELSKPVVIHDRDAHTEIMGILTDWAQGLEDPSLAGRLGVLHTFSGDLAMAEAAVDLGFYISFSGPVTYKNAGRLAGIVQSLPLDRILVETDCPFLAPHPHRGKRNEPAHVRLVVERIAALRGMSFADVAAATMANARQLFGF